jgi:hypothetical protein
MLNSEPNDIELARTLRAALPRAAAHQPSRDLWPEVIRRTQQPRRWSVADSSAAAIVVIALVMFPKWFWFVAYHL